MLKNGALHYEEVGMTWADGTAEGRNDDRMTAEDRLARVDRAERSALVTQAQRAVVQHPRVAVAIVTTVAKVTQRRRRERQARRFACKSRRATTTTTTTSV